MICGTKQFCYTEMIPGKWYMGKSWWHYRILYTSLDSLWVVYIVYTIPDTIHYQPSPEPFNPSVYNHKRNMKKKKTSPTTEFYPYWNAHYFTPPIDNTREVTVNNHEVSIKRTCMYSCQFDRPDCHIAQYALWYRL